MVCQSNVAKQEMEFSMFFKLFEPQVGKCRKGAACSYAHGEVRSLHWTIFINFSSIVQEDLRLSPDFERTSVCPVRGLNWPTGRLSSNYSNMQTCSKQLTTSNNRFVVTDGVLYQYGLPMVYPGFISIWQHYADNGGLPRPFWGLATVRIPAVVMPTPSTNCGLRWALSQFFEWNHLDPFGSIWLAIHGQH